MFCCTVNKLQAQNETILSSDTSKKVVPVVIANVPEKVKPPKPIVTEFSMGMRGISDGWGVYFNYGKAKTNDMKRVDMFHNQLFWEFEITEKYHPKEHKITSAVPSATGGTRSFKYGKINNFYTLNIGTGYQKLIAGKPDQGSVSIHWVNTLDFSLGLLKPYYIYLTNYTDPIKYSDDNQNEFLPKTAGSIAGGAGFSKGFNEMVFIPGGSLKTSFRFDFATDKRSVLGLEVGGGIDYYSQQVKLMANQDAQDIFYTLFFKVGIGRRW